MDLDLSQIQKEYENSIPEKLLHLEQLISDLRLFVHKLAGNAGAYGYDEVSALCKKFEQELLALKPEDYLKKIKEGFSHGKK